MQLESFQPRQDLRASQRFLLEALVTFESETNFFAGFSENIAEGGIFVATSEPPEVGARVRVRVCVNEQSVVAIGDVRWHRTGDDGSATGCGVRFLALDDRSRDLLQGMVSRAGQAPLLVE
jgi:uncharacterized protein (TIGR02266 family)